MRITWPQITLALLAVMTGAGLALQWQFNEELRSEIALLRGENQKVSQLRREHERLVTGQIPPATLERMRSDHAAVERLRAEVELMRKRVLEMEPTSQR
ncbi:MAG: hypothetical protein ABI222_17390 [Opitutaceae bacterium]